MQIGKSRDGGIKVSQSLGGGFGAELEDPLIGESRTFDCEAIGGQLRSQHAVRPVPDRT